MDYVLTGYARTRMTQRKLTEEDIRRVMEHPQQVLPEKFGRKAYQSLIVKDRRIVMLRLIVDDRQTPARVVTLCATTDARYWRL